MLPKLMKDKAKMHDRDAAADEGSSTGASRGGKMLNNILVSLGVREDNREALLPRSVYLDNFRKDLSAHKERQRLRSQNDNEDEKDESKAIFGEITRDIAARSKLPRSDPPNYICFKIDRLIELDDNLREVDENVVLRFRGNEANVIISTIAATCGSIATLRGKNPFCYVSQVVPHISRIEFHKKSNYNDSKALAGFIDYLNYVLPDEIERIEEDISNGVIAFWDLWYIFKRDKHIVSYYEGEKLGSMIVSSYYTGDTDFAYFHMNTNIIKSLGHCMFETSNVVGVDYYKGKRPFGRLPFHLMTNEEREQLTARGRIFNKVAVGHNFVDYNGFMLVQFGIRSYQVLGDGRIMIDQLNFSRMNPESPFATDLGNSNSNKNNNKNSQHQQARIPSADDVKNKLDQSADSADDLNDKAVEKTLPPGRYHKLSEENLCITFPTIMGYSMKRKEWGQFYISCISDIEFRLDAFDRLVLAADRKKLIEVLVSNVSNCRWRDIINEKGESGCVILLHGPPGTGKTLTAEAIAETLKKPLYTITTGQLGTDAKKLETSLQNHFDIGKQWDSVMLMDEADVFLEKRDFSDLDRNAMVGVFLRVLEYFPGILFLTTNRVNAFDDAFHSRISLSLSYEPLDLEGRTIVYRNLVPDDMKHIDFERLAREYDINGRQIKNVIRLAIKIADNEKRPAVYEDFVSILQSHRTFEENVKND